MKLVENIVKSGLGLLSRRRHPQTSGVLQFDGMTERTEIFRDSRGVPHIYAKNLHDLMMAQGFVHAQERMWQMEFNRRTISGRLSEVLGGTTLPVDRWLRTLTMRRIAESEIDLLSSEITNYLQSYADGINAFIKGGKLPIEFTLLRYKPEPWMIADTLAWIKMMAWGLSVNWEMEILRASLINELGAGEAALLEPPHLGRWPYIIPPGTDYSKMGISGRPSIWPPARDGLGSNNWVISGDHTETGMPLLANDMHLPISVPSIWFENHLVCDSFNVTGVTFPGIPGVISGHNGHVAWGYTNGFADVQDLYIERLKRTEDGRVLAEYNGNWEEVRVLREEIRIKGGSSAIEEVIVTRHGPIINNLMNESPEGEPLALRWTALEPDTMIQGIFEMLQARNCTEFHQTLGHWTTPNQNIVYADIQGNIAYTYAGKIPLRTKGDGRVPVPGWNDEHEWAGYVPFDQLPHLYNPPEGYIVTANNRVFDQNFPVNIEVEPISGDRAQRIVELIEHRLHEKLSIGYIEKMQSDQLSPSAREITRLFNSISLDISSEESELREIIGWMKSWDGVLSADSKEAVVYQAFIRKLIEKILVTKLSKEELVHSVMGKGPNPILARTSLMGELWLPWLTDILADLNRNWAELGIDISLADMILDALEDAIGDLKSSLGPDPNLWSWGQIHQLTFSHVISANPTLGAFFNRGPFASGGDQSTIWASGSSYHDLSSEQFIGPPYRMIIDLGDLNNSKSVLIPGQSGIPSNYHYDDQIQTWFNGKYHPIIYQQQEVEKKSTELLILMPG
jgi:penicillin amidase